MAKSPDSILLARIYQTYPPNRLDDLQLLIGEIDDPKTPERDSSFGWTIGRDRYSKDPVAKALTELGMEYRKALLSEKSDSEKSKSEAWLFFEEPSESINILKRPTTNPLIIMNKHDLNGVICIWNHLDWKSAAKTIYVHGEKMKETLFREMPDYPGTCIVTPEDLKYSRTEEKKRRMDYFKQEKKRRMGLVDEDGNELKKKKKKKKKNDTSTDDTSTDEEKASDDSDRLSND